MIAIIVYLGAMLYVGYRCSKNNHDTTDFYLGGRKLGPLVTAMSAEASDMSSWLLMGLPGLPALLKSRHYAGGSIRETAILPNGQEVFAIQQTSGEERLEEGENIYVCWDANEAALVR